MLLAATVALTGLLQAANTQSAPPGVVLATYKMAGRDVVASIPAASGAALPGVSSVGWEGWSYLVGEKGTLLGKMKTAGGWADVAALHAEAKAKIGDTTPQLRLKVVIFTRLDVLDSSQQGVLRQRRSTLEESMVARSLESVARTCAIVEAYGGGRFRVVPDVDIENDAMHGGTTRAAFDEDFLQWYFGPRINGGEFEAEDKIYRGPFDSVMFVHPGAPGDGQPTGIVNGSPVTGIAYDPTDNGDPKTDLTQAECAALLGLMARAGKRWGVPQPAFLSPQGLGGSFDESPEDLLIGPLWGKMWGKARPSVDDCLAALARKGKPTPTAWSEVADDPWRKLPWLAPEDIAKFAGKARLFDVGQPGRFHSFVLTPSADMLPGSKPEPAAVGLDADIVSGRESLAVVPYGDRRLMFVVGGMAPFVGAHLKAALGAKAIGATFSAGERFVVFDIGSTDGIDSELGLLDLGAAAPTAHTPGADRCEPVRWRLTYAKRTEYVPAEGTTPDATSPQAESRAMAAASLTNDSTAARRAAVVALLTAREDSVKLNAAQAFTRVKEPTAEAPLIELTNTYNTRLAEIALRALAYQGSDAAWAAVTRVMNFGRYDYSRQIAATLIGSRSDPNQSAALSTMLTARSWQARQAAAEAIGTQKDLKSQRILMAFLNEVDPGVRLSVVKLANSEQEHIAHDLLWPAVNDPADQVRAWCYIGLIRSGKDATRQEGYKGVRDDSLSVRLAVLKELRDRPSADHRAALRLAAADSNAVVRAAALDAFAKMPGNVTVDELGSCPSDKDPEVGKALIGLAKAKSIKLPAATLAMLRSCPDPDVASEAKELPE